MAPESAGQQDLRTYLRVFWRWKLLFIAFVVLIPLGAYLVERGKPKMYQSSTLMELQDISQGIGTSGAPVVTGNLAAVARLATTTPVVDIAAKLLHEPPGSLVNQVQPSADPNTGFLTITAVDHDPVHAAAIANAFAAALARHQTDQANAVIRGQIAAAARQLAATPRSAARPTRDTIPADCRVARPEGLHGLWRRGRTGGDAVCHTHWTGDPARRRARVADRRAARDRCRARRREC